MVCSSLAAAVSVPVSVSLTTAKIIAMTTLQKIAVSAVLLGAGLVVLSRRGTVTPDAPDTARFERRPAEPAMVTS